jgi:7-keto-8-aminopelargonate synthetase-like enzyme
MHKPSVQYPLSSLTFPNVEISLLRRSFQYEAYVSDKAVNFAIQKGLQISRSTVRWYEHNDMDDLERVLEEIRVEQLRSRKPLTRRFIVAEGLSENFGDIVDLPRIVRPVKLHWLI